MKFQRKNSMLWWITLFRHFSDIEKKPELYKCFACDNVISERASSCPKCGYEKVEKSACDICNKPIPINSKSCPECGDPNPFEKRKDSISEFEAHDKLVKGSRENDKTIIDETSGKKTNQEKKQRFNWKAAIAAFVIAFFLNIVLSAAAGVEPRKNIIWTVIWIYLTIDAWKYWRWKALLPYSLFIVITAILRAVALSIETINIFHVIGIMAALNLGGLAVFEILLYKSRKAKIN